MSTPVNHHFIPKVFIKGFTNDKGHLYGYDKETDRIDPRSSAKSVFHEKDRYTTISISIEKQFHMLESVHYKYYDDRFTPTIKYFVEKDFKEAKAPAAAEHYNFLSEFIIQLLLRVPKFDEQLNEHANKPEGRLFDENDKEVIDKETLDSYRKDESFTKIQRYWFIENVIKHNFDLHRGHTFSHSIANSDKNLFLLGDYPMLYPNDPHDLTLLVRYPVVFPISGNRAYYNFNLPYFQRLKSPDGREVSVPRIPDFYLPDHYLDINALIIDQSVKLICGPDRQILEESVAHYKKLKAENRLEEVRERLFAPRQYKSINIRRNPYQRY